MEWEENQKEERQEEADEAQKKRECRLVLLRCLVVLLLTVV